MSTGSLPGVKSGRGVTLTPHPPSSGVGHERVELYLYSPYGPYGLYTASVPVQGRPLPYYICKPESCSTSFCIPHVTHFRSDPNVSLSTQFCNSRWQFQCLTIWGVMLVDHIVRDTGHPVTLHEGPDG